MEAGPVSLFDTGVGRESWRHQRHSEGRFDYLNQSGRPMFEAVRQLLDSWWRDLPASERLRCWKAFRSGGDSALLSAFWEMYLHRSLRAVGYRPVWHPKSRSRLTMPDFKAVGAGNFYLEATMFGMASI